MHKARRWILLLALLLLAGAYLRFRPPAPLPVVVVPVTRGTVEATVTNTRAGTLKACRRARLSLPVGGQIARLLVHEGQQVAAGTLLLELWNRDRAAALAVARAERDAAQARAREACAPVVAAYRELVRVRKLVRRKAASPERLDRARAEADSRQAACEAAQASLQVARARVEAAQAALDQTRLRAPFAGTVAEINGEVSEYVTPSPVGVATLPVIDLIDTRCLYASAPIDEVEAPRLHPGLPVRIHLDAFPGRAFPGRLVRIAAYVQTREKQARTVEVEAEFTPRPAGVPLLPGYTTDVEVLLAVHRDVLRVPTEALQDGTVYRLTPDDRLERVRVVTGLHNWQWTEIRHGLRPGDRIVLDPGRTGLAPGRRVRPRPGTLPEPGDRSADLARARQDAGA
ncbi:MAG: efflux RND transporter periplasmic adaptor subunit [Gammaproteobacteria bacterium]|nr:MAG: efflux RND transporter periplasmic adaptor subunit [Gammaproteobacteria bacterium]